MGNLRKGDKNRIWNLLKFEESREREKATVWKIREKKKMRQGEEEGNKMCKGRIGWDFNKSQDPTRH